MNRTIQHSYLQTNQTLPLPTGIAIIGCGYWGMNYLRIFHELLEARVIVACDQSSDRLKEVARRYPGLYLTPQITEAVCHPAVEAVVVCTEATTHYDVTRRVLLSGKHALVEKPLTATSSEADELTGLAKSTSAVLMVDHTFIFNSGIRKVKELVKKPEGRTYYLYARRTNLGPIRHDVSALWDLAPHDIAIFNFLLDSVPEWVSAVSGKVLGNCRDDVGFISLGYPGNVLGHIHVSWADPDKAREVVVVRSDSRIVFNDLSGVEPVRVFEKGVTTMDQEALNYGELRFQFRDGDIISPRIPPSEPLKNVCRHFLECIRNRQEPVSGAVQGREVVRVLEAVNRSIQGRGQQVEVENDYAYGRTGKAAASAVL